MPYGGLKALPLPPGPEYDPYYPYAEGARPYPPPMAREGGSSRRRKHSDRRNKKAILAALTKLLLEPSSPSDSDEDIERLSAR